LGLVLVWDGPLQNLGFPLYIGYSNKSFLDILDWPEAGKNCSRAEKTVAVSQFLTQKGVEYLRLHKLNLDVLAKHI
jgi:hypothetical protein